MMHISFAWTTPALLARRKTCTRRNWSRKHAEKFHGADLAWGLDKSFRFGGRRVAIVQLTVDPYVESTADMPEEDYEAEGLAWMEEQGLLIRGKHPREFWDDWRAAAEPVYVVRLDLLARLGPDRVTFVHTTRLSAEVASRVQREINGAVADGRFRQVEIKLSTEAD
jgi:hypothetical protein